MSTGTLRAYAPEWVKRNGRMVSRTFGRYTADSRMLPSFLIAGGQRCGTTSLHRALIAHPLVTGPVFHKGINYFDVNYHRGPDWYRGHFPRAASVRRKARSWLGSAEPQAMESSGYYLYHPLALPRIAADLPDVKLIVMLRNPVERAYSAYKHEVARGFEPASFERALELEAQRLEGEEERLRTEPGYQSHAHRHQAYLARGRYAEQLERVFEVFARDRVHVLDSEDFFEAPVTTYAAVLEFLGLPDWMPASFDRHNARPGKALEAKLRRRLEDYYAPHDEALAELLGRQPAWRR